MNPLPHASSQAQYPLGEALPDLSGTSSLGSFPPAGETRSASPSPQVLEALRALNPQQSASPSANAPRKRIGDILIEEGYITDQQLQRALSESQATKTPIGTTMVKLGYIDEKKLGQCLAKLHGFEYADLADVTLQPDVMKLLPDDFIKRFMVIPLRVDLKFKRMEVVMARPDNLRVLDEIALLTGFRPSPKVSTHKEMVAVLDKYYRHNVSGDDAIKKIEEDLLKSDSIYEDSGVTSELEAEMAAEDAPVVMLVNSVLLEAIETGASDVHIEPQKERLLVRYRIDGILHESKSIPKKMASAVISRVKVASGMDIAERRRPQDGRMKIKTGTQEIDMRVNTLPVQFGEKICIRILKATATTGGIGTLGLSEEESRAIFRMIKAPNGIILVTGPTGSGKTTTLYSCLRDINNPEINITTIEDPIEYPLTGINQTPINSKAGMTFASALRAILRQDPDVILVGEIRDEETLESAIHAALTGHLVFSTLHTNSAAKTVTRLLEMGAPSYLVSSAVIGILAQRLVRRICKHCKTAYPATPEELEILGMVDALEEVTLYKGAGCDTCNHTGYSGRMGLYEIMRLSREIQEMVDRNESTFAIQDAAVRQGMYTLAMDGKRKILAGLTSVEEVTRVLGLELEG
ncbi:MAG: type II/IV secretion system protein [Vampirovibrionales bacterium]|nr:type II/IV secretion system protein [Vampirovibrionales bacterium]